MGARPSIADPRRLGLARWREPGNPCRRTDKGGPCLIESTAPRSKSRERGRFGDRVGSGGGRGTAAGTVLVTLAAGQFLMTLDSSVMNVSIATVAKDVGTTVTGIQTAITLYTLVMASLMITGGKIGQIVGRKRAFAIGCVIYGCGSFITAIAPNLGVLILGWSFLEGIGAALILPAIVALVASNFARTERPRAYGLVASAGAIAVAAGPLIGGPLHDLPVVAAGVRRRGARRRRDPRPDPAHGRRRRPRSASGSTSSAPACRRSGSG